MGKTRLALRLQVKLLKLLAPDSSAWASVAIEAGPALASASEAARGRIDIDSSLFNKNRIPLKAHSVLTIDFVDKPLHPTRLAYNTMVDFFRERLR